MPLRVIIQPIIQGLKANSLQKKQLVGYYYRTNEDSVLLTQQGDLGKYNTLNQISNMKNREGGVQADRTASMKAQRWENMVYWKTLKTVLLDTFYTWNESNVG